MELHRELPFGYRVDVTPSHGSDDGPYAIKNPYGQHGLMIGWNGKRGHAISITKGEAYDNETEVIRL